MLRASLARFEHDDYRLYVGHYRNDPATAAAIAAVADPRVRAVAGRRSTARRPRPTASTVLYRALAADEAAGAPRAKAIVLHDAEDLVHPLELRLFDRLVERAAWSSSPSCPCPTPRRAGSRAIMPTSSRRATSRNWSCARRSARRSRSPGSAARSSAARSTGSPPRNDGLPFAAGSLTEDYELGLRLGALGLQTMFVRIPAIAREPRRRRQPRPFPRRPRRRGAPEGALDRRHRAGRVGPAWLDRRDRRALDADARPARPARRLAARRGLCRAAAVAPDRACRRARRAGRASPPRRCSRRCSRSTRGCSGGGWLMRFAFTTAAYGWREGLRSIPRVVVANLVAILAARRALALHEAAGRKTMGQDAAHLSRLGGRAMSQATRFIMIALAGWIGLRAVSLGLIPGGEAIAVDRRAGAAPAARARRDAASPRSSPSRRPHHILPPAPIPLSAALSHGLCRPRRLRPRQSRARPALCPSRDLRPRTAHLGSRGSGRVQPCPRRGALCRRHAPARAMAARRRSRAARGRGARNRPPPRRSARSRGSTACR